MKELLRAFALCIQAQFKGFDSEAEGADTSILENKRPPIFIVGAPRTGSTLLYQIIVRQLYVSYISNIMAAFPSHMVKIQRIFPNLANGFHAQFHRGYHGFVPGFAAPSEAGKIIDSWFSDTTFPQNRSQIREMIAAISANSGQPFVLKCLTNATRLDQVLDVFPAALFVRISRDPLFVAQSIVLARRTLGIPDEEWWSVTAPGHENLKGLSMHYKAMWQALNVDKAIDASLNKLNVSPHVVHYEELCAAPQSTLSQLSHWAGLTPRSSAPELPICFKAAQEIRIPLHDWEALRKAKEQLSAAYEQ